MAVFLENCVTGPNFVATLLLGLVMLYWLMMIVTGIGVDGLDIDLDLDTDVDVDAALSVGGIVLKWLNIGRVPLMVWLTIFALSMWVISVSIPLRATDFPFWYSTLLVLRNGALALIPTKLLTHPLQGMFETAEPNTAEDMMGRVGLARTEISPSKGQAEFATEAAPLLVSVRTAQGFIEKGSEITVVGFDSETNMHLVERANSKNNQEV